MRVHRTYMLLAALAWPLAGGAEQPPGSENLFEFAAGPNEDGGFGATLRADLIDAPDWLKAGTDYYGFYGLAADSKWLSEEDALNQSTISAQLGLLTYKDWPMFWGAEPAIEIGTELFQRIGRFKSETDGQPQEANQTLIGLTASMQLPWGHVLTNAFADWSGTMAKVPKIAVSHFWLEDDEDAGDIPLPDKLVADNLVVGLSADLPFARVAVGKELTTLRLLLQADATKPTSGDDTGWQEFAEIKIVLDTGAALRPALVYTAGERNGLEYDQQVLLALFWSLNGGAAVSSMPGEAAEAPVPVRMVEPEQP